jgi:ssDNA-binding Zn-finger/Zn-ribbon topoisomerase 1
MTPRCPRCGAAMVRRHNSASGQPFWGCPAYPRCRGTVPADPPAPDPPDPARVTLQQQLRQVTRERDTLQAGYDKLLAEVRQLRRLKAPAPDTAVLLRELTRLIARCHPDKWGGESAVATALTQEILALRDRLQGGRS